MSKYTEILEKVQEYLQEDNNPEVKEGSITLYDLYNILDKSIKDLYKSEEADELLRKVNEENPIVKIVGKLFKKKEFLSNYQNIYLSLNDKDVSLSFYKYFSREGNFSICLDSESGELYSKYYELTNEQKRIIDMHYDEIIDILKSLKEYRDITGINDCFSKTDHKTQKISDGFMSAEITYDHAGRLYLKLGVSKEVDPEDISRRNYYSQEKIQNIINENQEQITKKIVVDEEILDESCKKLLNRNKNNKRKI